jgi:hypothetical protein
MHDGLSMALDLTTLRLVLKTGTISSLGPME